MDTLDNKVVAISGAGSGLGRELALQLSSLGSQLSLCDIDVEGLNKSVELCMQRGARYIESYVVDISDKQQVSRWATLTLSDFKTVNVLINNAGVSLNACIEHTSYDDFKWLIDINFWGAVYGTKEFLPLLKSSQNGHIVFVSSCFGLVSCPDQAAYNASKFAIRGFAESLALEVREEKSNIGVTCAHPGGIKTEFMDNARFGQRVSYLKNDEQMKFDVKNTLAKTSVEDAAEQIIRGILKNKRRLLIGPDSKTFDLIQRITPSHYGAFFTRTVDILTGQSSNKSASRNDSVRDKNA